MYCTLDIDPTINIEINKVLLLILRLADRLTTLNIQFVHRQYTYS